MNVINRVVSAALILGVASSALADSTGLLSPSSITVTTVGSYSWFNLTPASQASIDGDFAMLTLPGGGMTSDEVFSSGFGASVPSDATIDGIRLTFEFATDGIGGPGDDVTITMGVLATRGTNRIVEFTDTGGLFAPAVFGDGWDKWGLTLTPAIVNAPGFGVFSERTTVNSGTEKADLTQMEIFYTPAGAPRIDVGRGAVYVQVPSSYDSGTPTPLVLLLHGYGSSGAGQENYMDFGSLVDEFGFLYLHPDGRNESGGEFKRFWSGSSPCCNFYGAPDDDTAYLLALINEMKSQYNVDPQRVYFIGHSNGGFMSYRMACEHSDTIAAIATLAGATFLDPNDCLPTEAVNILQIHGTSDGTILYNGGNTFPGSLGEYPGAVETVEQWAAKNGCELVPDTSAPNIDLDGSQAGDETTVTRYLSSCDPSGQVELWTIVNGSHVPFPLSATFSRQVVEFLFAHPKAAPAPEGLPASRWGPIPLAVCLMLLGVGVIIRQRLRTRRE